jgi:hypothetical protein
VLDVRALKELAASESAKIFHQLCEGMTIRAIWRATSVSKNHDEHVLNLTSKRIQVDEVWSLPYKKREAHLSTE